MRTATPEALAILLALLALGLLALSTPAGAQEVKGSKGFGRPCGCNCPIVGGGATVQAAGQQVTVVAASEVILCGTAVNYDVVTGPVNPLGPVGVTPILVCYGLPCQVAGP